MSKAYVFPGQGAQFVGMGKDLYESNTKVKELLDKSKIPWTIQKYGNTSSVSVPLTICSELKDQMQGEKKILMSAFGVGMAWATAIVPFVDCRISEIVEI